MSWIIGIGLLDKFLSIDNSKIAKICGVALLISASTLTYNYFTLQAFGITAIMVSVGALSSLILVVLGISYLLDLTLFRKRARYTKRIVESQKNVFHGSGSIDEQMPVKKGDQLEFVFGKK